MSSLPLVSLQVLCRGFASRACLIRSAGAVGLVVGQPFDVVKVRYQTTAFAGQYRSTWGALGGLKLILSSSRAETSGNILKHEGTAGLFKGVLSPMVRTPGSSMA